VKRIVTETSRIRTPDGALANGLLTVTPNAEFRYLAGAEPRLVSATSVSVLFAEGELLEALELAPTKGETHSLDGVLYRVQWKFHAGGTVIRTVDEWWELDEAGDDDIEVTAVTRASVKGLPPYQVLSDSQTSAIAANTAARHAHANKALLDAYDDGDAAHPSRNDNPHGVTAAQIGLGLANNTPDADKPISNATQAELDTLTAAVIEAKTLVAAVTRDDDHVLVLTDAGKVQEMDAADPISLTFPADVGDAAVDLPIGAVGEIVGLGAGAVTLVAAGGVTLRRKAGQTLVLGGQLAAVSWRKRAADDYVIYGDLVTE